MRTVEPNLLYYGDNLDVLRQHIKDETVDLIYLDPPFNSNQTYNVLFAEQDGSRSAAQIKAFTDTWKWDTASAGAFADIVEKEGGRVAHALLALERLLGHNDMLAYVAMMAPRLVELKRVLKLSGSIYLHCDATASPYLRVLMDSVFGPENFRNEIIWRRTGSNNSADGFGPIHQTILFYVKSKGASFYYPKGPYTREYVEKFFKDEDARGRYQSVALTGPGTREGDSGKPWHGYDPTSVGRHWQPASYIYEKYKEITKDDLAKYPLLERFDKLDKAGLIHWGTKGDTVPRYKQYLADAPGVPYQDIWAYQPGTSGCVYGNDEVGIDEDVKWLSTGDKERQGYPTQKPEGLLDRIIQASSKEGDLILDPFCGCGTTVASAQRLGRRWVGIDVTHLAITLIRGRLFDRYDGEVVYEVVGEPTDLEGARALAKEDRYQFQWWALGRVNARPAETDQKKGADRGIDGRLYFRETQKASAPLRCIIIQVKSGHVSSRDIRDLVGVVKREDAAMGVFITLEEATDEMKKEAVEAAFYKPTYLTDAHERYPKIQILTIEDLLEGKGIQRPYMRNVTFKQSPRAPKTRMTKKTKGTRMSEYDPDLNGSGDGVGEMESEDQVAGDDQPN